MNDKEICSIEHLANESEKFSFIDEIVAKLSSRIENSEVVAWNGEVSYVEPGKNIGKQSDHHGSRLRLLSRRRSSTEYPNFTPRTGPAIKKKSLQNPIQLNSIEKKFPIITPKIPKLHYVQVPIQRYSQTIINSPNMQEFISNHYIEMDPNTKNIIKKTINPIDLIKKQELLYEYYPIKATNKSLEISINNLRKYTRPRRINSNLSTMDSLET